MEASVQGNGTFWTLVTGLFGPKRFFCLACHILDRFCFGLRLIQAPNKQASRAPFWFRDLSRQNHLVPGHLVPFFRPGHLVPLLGSPRPIFYNGFQFIDAILLCVKIYFFNRLLYIGKFYHISCNTVLFRLFKSVNALCLYVCIYTNKYYYYYNTVEEF